MSDDQKRDFGDEAEMSVHEKSHPAAGPTEASQDVESLPRHIVPMGAFNDPNNPVAVSGSVNMSLDNHPVTHDADYGKELHEVYGHDHVGTTMSDGAESLKGFDNTGGGEGGSAEDRSEWKKADWHNAAKEYGLSVSGNMAELQARVEDHESYLALSDEDRAAADRAEDVEAAKQLKAEDWKGEIEAAESAEALAELRSLYNESGADFSTVASAFDEREAEFKSNGS